MNILKAVTKSWRLGTLGNNVSEAALIRRAGAGDTVAFDQLIQGYQTPLQKFLYHRVSPSCLEDVIQETMLAAWLGLPQFRQETSFKAWLYRIALNKATDMGRSLSRRAAMESEIILQQSGSGRDETHGVDNRLFIQELLRELTAEQSLIIELYYQEEFTLAEIAALLDRNLNTVKYHFYRSHARLAELAAANLEEAGLHAMA